MNGDSDNSDEGESTSNQQIFGIEQNRRITSIHTTARLKGLKISDVNLKMMVFEIQFIGYLNILKNQ